MLYLPVLILPYLPYLYLPVLMLFVYYLLPRIAFATTGTGLIFSQSVSAHTITLFTNLEENPRWAGVNLVGGRVLTRAPLGYFYNAPHWGAISSPPLISETIGPIVKIQAAFESLEKLSGKTNFIDLGVTSDVTSQVKVKMFDFSGLVTSASKIAMLSSNKANESAWIMSLTFVSISYCAL